MSLVIMIVTLTFKIDISFKYFLLLFLICMLNHKLLYEGDNISIWRELILHYFKKLFITLYYLVKLY